MRRPEAAKRELPYLVVDVYEYLKEALAHCKRLRLRSGTVGRYESINAHFAHSPESAFRAAGLGPFPETHIRMDSVNLYKVAIFQAIGAIEPETVLDDVRSLWRTPAQAAMRVLAEHARMTPERLATVISSLRKDRDDQRRQ